MIEGIDVFLASYAVPLAQYVTGNNAWRSSSTVGSVIAAQALWKAGGWVRRIISILCVINAIVCSIYVARASILGGEGYEAIALALFASALSSQCAHWRELQLSDAERAVIIPTLVFAAADILNISLHAAAVVEATDTTRGSADEDADAARAFAGASALCALCTAFALAMGARERLSAEVRTALVGGLAAVPAALAAQWLRPRVVGGEIAWALRTAAAWPTLLLTWASAASLLIFLPAGNSREATVALRKVYHIVVAAAVALPLAASQTTRGPIAAALAGGVFALTITESFRALDGAPTSIRAALHDRVARHSDARDARVFILPHLYLIAGIATPLWLEGGRVNRGEESSRAILRVITAPLALGIGDAAAAVIGLAARRRGISLPWAFITGSGNRDAPGKTFVGSLAYVVTVTIVGRMCLGDVDEATIRALFISALVGASVEVLVGDADNVVVPIYAWAAAALA